MSAKKYIRVCALCGKPLITETKNKMMHDDCAQFKKQNDDKQLYKKRKRKQEADMNRKKNDTEFVDDSSILAGILSIAMEAKPETDVKIPKSYFNAAENDLAMKLGISYGKLQGIWIPKNQEAYQKWYLELKQCYKQYLNSTDTVHAKIFPEVEATCKKKVPAHSWSTQPVRILR